ncbi:hypothetical protein [Larsenimonas suaedae]|uniref:Rubredoxin n=1 Tax=Larsenimonas suaedae TaxID=1851019 RepID=A0ABU1GZ63_9GAMM|nr:hypothetical protein [Larsenimonas suaedae]MDR5897264.1 hypothetical protein [Larsenimonas suaedae]
MSHRLDFECLFCGYRWENYASAPVVGTQCSCPNCDQDSEAVIPD